MRNIPSNFSIETNKDITTPVYLVEFQFLNSSTGLYDTVRVSSRQQIDVDGDIFVETNPHFIVKNLAADKTIIEIKNPSSLMQYYTLTSEANDGSNLVKIWIYYGEATTITSTDRALFFDGIIDEVSSLNKYLIVYNCMAGTLPLMWTPRILIAPPLCNHLPKDGTKIGNIILERK